MNYDLSIVVTSRNDGHNSSLRSRMQTSIDTLFYQFKKYPVKTEVIIVEWNPPKEKKRLYEVLDFRNKPSNCTVRIITVPGALHNKIKNADKIDLFQFIAKNVGIRRANGKFVLATNADILFSNDLVRYLASCRLHKNNLIRAVRFDVPSFIVKHKNTDEMLRWCEVNKFRAFWPWGDENLRKNADGIIFRLRNMFKFIFLKNVFTNASGDFMLMSKSDWNELRGYPEFPYHGFKIDSLLCQMAHSMGIKQKILRPPLCVFHRDHPHSWRATKSKSYQDLLEAKGIPFLSTQQYNNIISAMIKQDKVFNRNNNSWGFGGTKLNSVEI